MTYMLLSKCALKLVEEIILKVVEEIKTHILCSITFLFENRTVYEIMWENTVERDRSQMTLWRTELHAGYLRLQTHTQNIHDTKDAIFIYCNWVSTRWNTHTAIMVTLTRLNVTLHVHRLSCINRYFSPRTAVTVKTAQ